MSAAFAPPARKEALQRACAPVSTTDPEAIQRTSAPASTKAPSVIKQAAPEKPRGERRSILLAAAKSMFRHHDSEQRPVFGILRPSSAASSRASPVDPDLVLSENW